MDSEAKHTLLIAVLNYACHFQRNRKRAYMRSSDIHEAIHALGLRPLFSTLSVTGDETTATNEVVSDPISGTTDGRPKLELIVPVGAKWIEPQETFRKRRIKIPDELSLMQISPLSACYIQAIINSVSSGRRLASLTPPSDSDVLCTSWFLGLFFSDTIQKSSSIDCFFVRSAIWYLQMAIDAHVRISRNASRTPVATSHVKFPASLSAPWIEGLNLLANGSVSVNTVSSNQSELIQSVCSQFSNTLAL